MTHLYRNTNVLFINNIKKELNSKIKKNQKK